MQLSKHRVVAHLHHPAVNNLARLPMLLLSVHVPSTCMFLATLMTVKFAPTPQDRRRASLQPGPHFSVKEACDMYIVFFMCGIKQDSRQKMRM